VSKARILIVDDDSNFRGAVAEYLNADGLEVVEAEDGVDALEMAEPTVPAAVAGQHHHAVGGGLQTLEALRRIVPDIALVTGRLDSELLQRATAAGAYTVLLKPVALAAISDAPPAGPLPPSPPG